MSNLTLAVRIELVIAILPHKDQGIPRGIPNKMTGYFLPCSYSSGYYLTSSPQFALTNLVRTEGTKWGNNRCYRSMLHNIQMLEKRNLPISQIFDFFSNFSKITTFCCFLSNISKKFIKYTILEIFQKSFLQKSHRTYAPNL